LGGRFPPATSTRPNRNTKTFVEPESDKTAGGLSDSSSCALFVSCRLNRGRQQPRPEASEPRAPVQAGREQRPVSGWVLVEASEGLRRAWPLQESDLSYPWVLFWLSVQIAGVVVTPAGIPPCIACA
jgi:hypothetical protein